MTTTLDFWQVDAFASKAFEGNPAAVFPLEEWLPEATLQAIAMEMNLSETAFFVPQTDGLWHLRWFTPVMEVPLCGHATVASAHVLFSALGETEKTKQLRFETLSGELSVSLSTDGGYELSAGADEFAPLPDMTADVAAALGAEPREVIGSRYLMAVYDDVESVEGLRPDMMRIGQTRRPGRPTAEIGIVATAAGASPRAPDAAFVSRFFAPLHDIPEDPVTGSAHCGLVPYWSQVLGTRTMRAFQASARGGHLQTQLTEDGRVLLGGSAVTVAQGQLFLP